MQSIEQTEGNKTINYPTIVPTPTSLSTVTPAMEVNNSGAEEPAAMKVAPATSSLKFSFSLIASNDGTKKSSHMMANAKYYGVRFLSYLKSVCKYWAFVIIFTQDLSMFEKRLASWRIPLHHSAIGTKGVTYLGELFGNISPNKHSLQIHPEILDDQPVLNDLCTVGQFLHPQLNVFLEWSIVSGERVRNIIPSSASPLKSHS